MCWYRFSLTYNQTSNYNPTDMFFYSASHDKACSGIATVRITVGDLNDAPVAINDSYTTAEDTTMNVSATGVLANDGDIDGDTLYAVLVSQPTHGSLRFNTDGSFSYTPTSNFVGTDSFTYKANDGQADSGIATVTITIGGANDAPVAVNDRYTTAEDTTLNVAAPGVLANDSDIDGDTLGAVLVSQPTHGTLTFNSDGHFSYTSAGNYNGTDSITYKANDGQADSGIATVNITITAVNDAPLAVNDSYTTAEDTTLNVAAAGVLANDSDVDGDSLSALLVSQPTHGSLTLNSDGSFSYAPTANYNGTDTFTYKATGR